jgi:hypothetical protein
MSQAAMGRPIDAPECTAHEPSSRTIAGQGVYLATDLGEPPPHRIVAGAKCDA